MRILFVDDVPEYFVSGSTNFYKRLGTSLQKKGHEVAVICPGRTFAYDEYEKGVFKVYGLPSVPVGFIQKRFRITLPFFISHRIRKIISDFKPDVIHVQVHWGICEATAKIAKANNISIVATNHFLPENLINFLPIPRILKPALARAMWHQLHRVFNTIDTITTPTQTAAQALRESGFAKSVTPISCGVDLAIFNPQNNGEYLSEKYKLPPVPRILYVSRLDPEKSVDTLLRALPQVLAHTPAHLVLVGRGSMEQKLKQLAEELHITSHVTFTGFLPNEDLPNIYRTADCFVMPSGVELQSIATMEAMASGLPTLAADAMALPELVHHNENGLLFPLGDSATLAREITRIITDKDLAHRMAQESLTIIANHAMVRTIEQFELLYAKAQSSSQKTSSMKSNE